MKHLSAVGAGLLLGLVPIVVPLVGCAASTPKDLITARAAYERVSRGAAANLDPEDLHYAKKALDDAEECFSDHGNTARTRQLARESEESTVMAEARARALGSGRDVAADAGSAPR